MTEVEQKPYGCLFPHDTFRPDQDKMLDAVWDTVNKCGMHEVILISAPTGSGKSSVVVPSIVSARKNGLKVVIAVNTKAQISIYINELESLKKKDPTFTYAYILGKAEACQLNMNGRNVYLTCMNYKNATKRSLKQTTLAGNGMFDEGTMSYFYNDDVCPYYGNMLKNIGSEVCLNTNAAAHVRDVLSKRRTTEQFIKDTVDKGFCPYEVSIQAALNSDVVVVNYMHIMDDTIRNALFNAIGYTSEDTILIIDEAHNVGNKMCGTHTALLTQKTVDAAISSSRAYEKNAMFSRILKDILTFMKEYIVSKKQEEREARTAGKKVTRGKDDRNYIYDITKDLFFKYQLSDIQDAISELTKISKKNKDEASRLTGKADAKDVEDSVDTVVSFLKVVADVFTLKEQGEAPIHIGVAREQGFKQQDGKTNTITDVELEIRNTDPSLYIRTLVEMFSSTVMVSGTLEPVETYEKLYFGPDYTVQKLVLQNHFPQENRTIIGINDIDTLSKNRTRPDYYTKYHDIVSAFCGQNGNVAVFGASYGVRNMYCTYCDTHDKWVVVEPSEQDTTFFEIQGGIPRGTAKECNSKYPKPGCKSYLASWEKQKNILDLDDQAKMLNAFKAFPASGKEGVMFAVCGGKWSEGIDYKGDMLKAVMILGVPLAAYDTVQASIISTFKQKYADGREIAYDIPAVNKAVQASGRLLRTENDTGLMVFADYRYCKGGPYHKFLPKWLQDEMHTMSSEQFVRYMNSKGSEPLPPIQNTIKQDTGQKLNNIKQPLF